jgi:hypothetical protein
MEPGDTEMSHKVMLLSSWNSSIRNKLQGTGMWGLTAVSQIGLSNWYWTCDH